MSRRWHPPGRGWVRTADCGSLAVWMRPEPDGLTIAMYAAGYFHYPWPDAEIWVVRVPSTSRIPYLVMDKPHRIRWVLDSDGDPELGALSVERATVRPSHRGHRRLNRNRRIWRWPLPRRIRTALEAH